MKSKDASKVFFELHKQKKLRRATKGKSFFRKCLGHQIIQLKGFHEKRFIFCGFEYSSAMKTKKLRGGHIAVTKARVNVSRDLLNIPLFEVKATIPEPGKSAGKTAPPRSKSAGVLTVITNGESTEDTKERRVLAADSSLPQLDMKTKDKLDRVRLSVQGDVDHINRLLKKASTNEPRKTGTGSWGGPIARKVKSPGPHNGITYEATGIRSPQLNLTPEQMQEIMKDHDDVYLEEWDRNFTVGMQLSEKIKRSDIVYDVLFKSEIKKFKSLEPILSLTHKCYLASGFEEGAKKVASAESPPKIESAGFLERDSSPSILEVAHVGGSVTTMSVPSSTANSSGNKSPKKQLSPRPQTCAIGGVKLAWQEMVISMHMCTASLTYKDLTDIACMRCPPAFVVHLMGFIGVLLGLEPSWQAAKRTMFHEIVSMQNFLCNVEPLTIPTKRIRTALEMKDSMMPGLSIASCKGVYGPRSFIMLSMWVLKFTNLGRIIVAVRDSINYTEGVTASLAEGSVLSLATNSLVTAASTRTKISGGHTSSTSTMSKKTKKRSKEDKDVIGSQLDRRDFFDKLVEEPSLSNGRFNPGSIATADFNNDNSLDASFDAEAEMVLANMSTQIEVSAWNPEAPLDPIQASTISDTEAASSAANGPDIAADIFRNPRGSIANILNRRITAADQIVSENNRGKSQKFGGTQLSSLAVNENEEEEENEYGNDDYDFAPEPEVLNNSGVVSPSRISSAPSRDQKEPVDDTDDYGDEFEADDEIDKNSTGGTGKAGDGEEKQNVVTASAVNASEERAVPAETTCEPAENQHQHQHKHNVQVGGTLGADYVLHIDKKHQWQPQLEGHHAPHSGANPNKESNAHTIIAKHEARLVNKEWNDQVNTVEPVVHKHVPHHEGGHSVSSTQHGHRGHDQALKEQNADTETAAVSSKPLDANASKAVDLDRSIDNTQLEVPISPTSAPAAEEKLEWGQKNQVDHVQLLSDDASTPAPAAAPAAAAAVVADIAGEAEYAGEFEADPVDPAAATVTVDVAVGAATVAKESPTATKTDEADTAGEVASVASEAAAPVAEAAAAAPAATPREAAVTEPDYADEFEIDTPVKETIAADAAAKGAPAEGVPVAEAAAAAPAATPREAAVTEPDYADEFEIDTPVKETIAADVLAKGAPAAEAAAGAETETAAAAAETGTEVPILSATEIPATQEETGPVSAEPKIIFVSADIPQDNKNDVRADEDDATPEIISGAGGNRTLLAA